MTTTVERTTKEQRTTTTRPPGWVPDRHTGPGEWLTILIALSVIAIALIAVGLWSMSDDAVVVDPNAVMAERWMARGAAEWRAEVGETAYREAIIQKAYVDRVTGQAIAAWQSQLANDLMAQRWIARATAAWLAEGGELDFRSALADYPYWDGPPAPVVPPPVETRADMLARLGAPDYVIENDTGQPETNG
jgi:hypothetical protein